MNMSTHTANRGYTNTSLNPYLTDEEAEAEKY